MSKFIPAALVLLPLLLTACTGDGNTGSGNGTKVEITDSYVDASGNPVSYSFTYIATPKFQPSVISASNLTTDEQALLQAINAARAQGGTCINPANGQPSIFGKTPALVLESHIYAAAQGHAQSMATNNYFSHQGLTDATRTEGKRIVSAGYTPIPPTGVNDVFAENLAKGQMTAQEVVDDWIKNSYSHCVTVFRPLVYGGVAKAKSTTTNDNYWVLDIAAAPADLN